jgi:hypothetical protein
VAGAAGNGEPLAIMPRTGSAGSNTAADHIGVTRLALAHWPGRTAREIIHKQLEQVYTRFMSA